VYAVYLEHNAVAEGESGEKGDHSLQQVIIKGGDTPLSPKNEGPLPTLSSEALLSEKITKNSRKRQQIAKNAQSCSKVAKIGPNSCLIDFLTFSRLTRPKRAENTPFYIIFTNIFSFPCSKIGTPTRPFV
jgi:hypothetical protein